MMRLRDIPVAALLLVLLLSCGKADVADEPQIPEEPERDWTFDTDVFYEEKRVALLDMTVRNGETEDGSSDGRNLYSATHILEVAGIPFFTTKNLSKALEESNMILFSSAVRSRTFSDADLKQLSEWVEKGGVVVSPACVDAGGAISELFGIQSSSYSKKRFSVSWEDGMMMEKELEYMDEPEEKDISLGNAKLGEAIKSYGYTLSTAACMARFSTGEPAVAVNALGNGRVYSFGVLWRDVIQRPQLNKDFLAQRSYSNDFEPSADAFPLFVRSVYAKHNEISVWKSTVPDGYCSVLIPTHDCDSRSAYDEMYHMSGYEKSIGMKGHYFLTTHYYRDSPYLSAFYDAESVGKSLGLIADGHTVGSHSVGHFPDFSVTANFPILKTTREEYTPHYDLSTGTTTGGSTWAELALSKKILEEDLGNRVRSFRSGHLAMNKNIPVVLEEEGYSFSSCYGAGDVMTCFPFFDRIGNEWTGRQSKVLQMPLHFSDVINDNPMNEENWHEKPDLWLKIMNKLAGNYAPSVLLIHPNRQWKMEAEKMLVEKMDRTNTALWNFEDYGDFWIGRRNLTFGFSGVEGKEKVMIRVSRSEISENPHLSFMVELPEDSPQPEVVLLDENSYAFPMRVKKMASGKYMACQ